VIFLISTASLIAMAITAAVTILGPILAAIVFYRKQKYFAGSVFTGAAVFFLFQIVLRIPILQLVLPKMEWYRMLQNNLWGYAIFLGFTAGLFEEVGRYLAFTTVLKKHQDWKNAVAFGIGHGGIESILLVGFTYISNLMISIMINKGLYDSLFAQNSQQSEALAQAKALLIETPSYMYLIAGVERILTFIIHIALSVLIMEGIRKKKGLQYLGLAIFLHMVIDSPVVILSGMGANVLFIELLALIFAVISFVYVKKQMRKEMAERAYENEYQH